MKFSIDICASNEKVWDVLWNDTSYRQWTSVFAENSHVVTDNWKEGTRVLFLDGKGSGMVSKVAANKPGKYMSFQHLGEVRDGVEDTTSDKIKTWAGSFENYTLEEKEGNTHLMIDMDIVEEFKDIFVNTWPKALELVKNLAEKN